VEAARVLVVAEPASGIPDTPPGDTNFSRTVTAVMVVPPGGVGSVQARLVVLSELTTAVKLVGAFAPPDTPDTAVSAVLNQPVPAGIHSSEVSWL
jgi:hypothetical protein